MFPAVEVATPTSHKKQKKRKLFLFLFLGERSAITIFLLWMCFFWRIEMGTFFFFIGLGLKHCLIFLFTEVKLQETAPELYTPVSVIFTPNVPVPDNLTDILLIPSTFLGQDPTTCIKQECQNTIQWDMVFFTKRTQNHIQRDSSLDVLKCTHF